MNYKYATILKFLQMQELYMAHFPTVGEIAKAVKMPRTTVRRLLISLCSQEMVETHQVPYRGKFCWKFEATTKGYIFADSFKSLPNF